MATYSAVDCTEEHNTAQEDFDAETGFGASVTLRCLWSDRLLLMDDILSNSRTWPYNAKAQAHRATSVPAPSQYTTSGQGAEYIHALVTVEYSTKIKDLISESLEPAVEFLTTDHKQFRWASVDGEPLLESEAPAVQYKTMNLARTLYQLPAIPAAVLTCVGCSNSASYTSALLGLTFGVETLLFQPPTTNRAIKTSGTDGWTLNTKFTFKPQGWNKFWRPGKDAGAGGWDEIVHIKGTVYKPYPPANFAAFLF
jgi:hypothetical protein